MGPTRTCVVARRGLLPLIESAHQRRRSAMSWSVRRCPRPTARRCSCASCAQTSGCVSIRALCVVCCLGGEYRARTHAATGVLVMSAAANAPRHGAHQVNSRLKIATVRKKTRFFRGFSYSLLGFSIHQFRIEPRKILDPDFIFLSEIWGSPHHNRLRRLRWVTLYFPLAA